MIAAESASFVEVFVRRGLVPDGGGAYLLPRLIGLQKTKELMFFGTSSRRPRPRSSAWPTRWCPTTSCWPWPASGPVAWPRAPARSSPTKWLINRSLDSDRAGSFHDEAMAQDLNMTTADAQEGVASFVERRDPDYKGW